jgi:hypothetical protein
MSPNDMLRACAAKHAAGSAEVVHCTSRPTQQRCSRSALLIRVGAGWSVSGERWALPRCRREKSAGGEEVKETKRRSERARACRLGRQGPCSRGRFFVLVFMCFRAVLASHMPFNIPTSFPSALPRPTGSTILAPPSNLKTPLDS